MLYNLYILFQTEKLNKIRILYNTFIFYYNTFTYITHPVLSI